jgi:hypothetical protein
MSTQLELLAHHGRNLLPPEFLDGTKPTVTGDELVLPTGHVIGSHDNRLDQAVLVDTLRQHPELLRIPITVPKGRNMRHRNLRYVHRSSMFMSNLP